MADDSEDTNITSRRDIEMNLLAKIHEEVIGFGDRLEAMESKMSTLIQDVNIVHKFQQSFVERLSIVEKFCVERPLRSTTKPKSKAAGNSDGT